MPSLNELVDILDVEELDRNLFRGRQAEALTHRIFGGQVVAQSMAAACRTVERPIRSLHGYFIRAGDTTIPIVFHVDRLRDGGSFSVRRVLAVQNGEAIFSMGCSFQEPEPGFEHQVVMPDVPDPDVLASDMELIKIHGDKLTAQFQRLVHYRPFESRPTDVERFLRHEVDENGRRSIWFKAKGTLPASERSLHDCILGYLSDMALIDVAFNQHGRTLFQEDMLVASLDHAVWFHRPFRADEWMLYALDSPSTSGGRGLARGSFFTRDGKLIASVAQEGMIRTRRPKAQMPNS